MRFTISKSATRVIFIIFVIASFILSPLQMTPAKAKEINSENPFSESDLKIKQGGIFHLNTEGRESLTFPLDVLEQEEGLYYNWEALVSPAHGEIAYDAEGDSIKVSYIPQDGFTGTDVFTMQVTDSMGQKAESNIIISVEQQLIPPNLQQDSVNDLVGEQTYYGVERETRGNLYMVVRPEDDAVIGFDCITGAEVSITISSSGPWVGQCDDNSVWINTGSFDIQAGQTVTMSDGTNEATHIVTSLTVTEVNAETDIVSGTAAAGSDVTVEATVDDSWDQWDSFNLTANPSGDWTADFSSSVDLQAGSYGFANQYDEDGNRTEIYFNVPDPYFNVYPLGDYIRGYDWKPDSQVTLTIESDEWTELSDNEGAVIFYPTLDIVPGQTVVLSDGVNERSHVVRDISITEMNSDTEIITGKAEPLSEVYVYAHTNTSSKWLYPIADSNGVWQADCSSYLDLDSGSYSWVYQYDEQGNSTRVNSRIPDPYVNTYPLANYLYGQDWTPDATVTLTIGTNQWTEQSDYDGFVYFPLDPFDLQAGQHIHMTDGEYEIDYMIKNLAVTDINPDLDTVSGTADPDTTVNVLTLVYIPNTVYLNGVEVIALTDANGDWDAVFPETDITTASNGQASIVDDNNNSTTVNWYIPNPGLSVDPQYNQVWGYSWPQNTEITLEIENHQWAMTSNAYGHVEFNIQPFDILPGQTIHMSGGGYERTYIVKNLAITNVDQAADIVLGMADAGSNVIVSVTSIINSSGSASADLQRDVVSGSLMVETNASGIWEADFSGLVDIGTYYSVSASLQEEGNGSTVVTIDTFVGYETYVPLLIH